MGLISAIFSILTIVVGGVCIMLFVSTKTLRDSRDDQEKRITFLEAERARDRQTISDQQSLIAAAEAKALSLIADSEKLDTLGALIQSLSELLAQHHSEARQNWVVVTAGLGHLGTATDHMSESVDRLVEHLESNQ